MARTLHKNKNRQRGKRALERQLDYQVKKSVEVKGQEQAILLRIFNRANSLQKRLSKIHSIKNTDKILEVGSGAHGLVFGFENNFAVGIDPLAVEYKRLFPIWQQNTQTLSAIGEKLPFGDSSFEIVLSDNVIDHAEDPVGIIEEFARVLKPNGLLYFTVNVHHPIYQIASDLHGFWNSIGIKYEISPFADHTIHFSEEKVLDVFAHLPFNILEQNSTVNDLKEKNHRSKPKGIEERLKNVFYKNAQLEIIAVRK